MRLDELAQALRDFEARLVELGVSRQAALKAAMDAENVAVADLLETQADLRLVGLFEEVGGTLLAERKGVSRSAIYRDRTDALNRLSAKNVSRPARHLMGQEVA